MVTGTWNSDRFWTRSRNVQRAHVRHNGANGRARAGSPGDRFGSLAPGPRLVSLSLSLALSLSRSLFLLLRLLLFPRLALNPIAPGEHGDGDDDDSIARTRRSRRETDDPVGEIG